MAVSPDILTSVPALREAIRSGQITEFTVLVGAVRVSGDLQGTTRVRGVASTIGYDLVPFDTTALFDPAALENVKPVNRPIEAGGIFAARIGDVMKLVRYGVFSPKPLEYRLYDFGNERPDWHLCNGQPLEP